MKVLLDECLPKKLKREVEADFFQTVPEAGWASKQNGELLRLAEVDYLFGLSNRFKIEYAPRQTTKVYRCRAKFP